MKKVYLGAIINPVSPEQCDFYKNGALLVNEDGKSLLIIVNGGMMI